MSYDKSSRGDSSSVSQLVTLGQFLRHIDILYSHCSKPNHQVCGMSRLFSGSTALCPVSGDEALIEMQWCNSSCAGVLAFLAGEITMLTLAAVCHEGEQA